METHAARFAFLSSLHTPVILSLMLAITESKDCWEEAVFGTGRQTIVLVCSPSVRPNDVNIPYKILRKTTSRFYNDLCHIAS